VLALDTFTRFSTAGWGTADLGGVWTQRFTSAADATTSSSLDGARGNMTISTGSALLILVSYVGPTGAGDYSVVSTTQAGQTSGSRLLVVGRVVDQNHFYAAQLDLTGSMFAIRKNVNGLWTTLASVSTPTLAASTDYQIRLDLQGTSLRAKWWVAGQLEPVAWAVEATDSTYSVGQTGVGAAMTNTRSTGTYKFDDFSTSAF